MLVCEAKYICFNNYDLEGSQANCLQNNEEGWSVELSLGTKLEYLK